MCCPAIRRTGHRPCGRSRPVQAFHQMASARLLSVPLATFQVLSSVRVIRYHLVLAFNISNDRDDLKVLTKI